MPTVEALSSFDHNGNRRRGTQFPVSKPVADELAKRGLVRIIVANPTTAVGAKSSALPAVPVSPKQTAKKSKRGARKLQNAVSS